MYELCARVQTLYDALTSAKCVERLERRADTQSVCGGNPGGVQTTLTSEWVKHHSHTGKRLTALRQTSGWYKKQSSENKRSNYAGPAMNGIEENVR